MDQILRPSLSDPANTSIPTPPTGPVTSADVYNSSIFIQIVQVGVRTRLLNFDDYAGALCYHRDILNAYRPPPGSLEAVMAALQGVTDRLDRMDTKFNRMEAKFNSIETKFNSMETKFDRLGTKIDTANSLAAQAYNLQAGNGAYLPYKPVSGSNGKVPSELTPPLVPLSCLAVIDGLEDEDAIRCHALYYPEIRTTVRQARGIAQLKKEIKAAIGCAV